ncbi:Uncharacterized membrane protein YbhN, UPF0104 family [Pseudomonas delhiensis]|uniref:Uncharacterized membrane protein YbhN, UPF0104 family n=1 Tax=Pseudomonas delhiensis TaxID=366289 RepID=A0A239G896_9PSED|nr:Uncharacterized membrane protein YbhN, UPF0104 family [Pseudomonas delhiensis]SNS65576.1 Uncharacterized membrane protein YbhN, UPF0104 family [Pseudomonas delhiensis]
MQIKKIVKKLAPVVISIIFAGYCYLHRGDLYALLSFPRENLFIILILYIAFHLINALIIKSLTDKITPTKSIAFFIGVNQISSALNYIAPFRLAQFTSRAAILKKYLSISITTSAAQFLISSVFNILCSILITMAIIGYAPKLIPNSLALSAISLGLLGAIALTLYVIRKSKPRPWLTSLTEPFKSLTIRDTLHLSILNILQIAIASAITYQLLDGTGMSFKLTDCILLSTASVLLSIASLTPGNLGYKELSLTALGVWLGLDQGTLLAVLILDRSIQLVLTFVLASFFTLAFKHITPHKIL